MPPGRDLSQEQVRREYREESAQGTLRAGRLVALITIPAMLHFIDRDRNLDIGNLILGWRLLAIATPALFLVGSFTVLPKRLGWVVPAHVVGMLGVVVHAAGICYTLFTVRPENQIFTRGSPDALLLILFGVWVLASGARRHLWLVAAAPIVVLAAALAVSDALAPEEWAYFTNAAVGAVLLSILAVLQERLRFDEYSMRRWALHRKEALEDRLLQVRRLNKQLREFSYIVSHDLKEPLRTVRSFLDLGLERMDDLEIDDESLRRHLSFAREGGTRMEQLVDGLLAYARLDTADRSFAPLSLEEVLDEAKANLEGSIRECGAMIRAEPLPTVTGDRKQLVQLFQNLVGNAIKYRKPGRPPTIAIDCEPAGEDDVVVHVRDNGIGIDAKDQERVFRIFQRLHTADEIAGTGVGLSLCRRIVERHGGKISLTSTPDEGATFSVTLHRSGDETGGGDGALSSR